jgi:hypothetical protein
MTTVARRCFNSTPARDAHDTWAAIVALLTRGQAGAAADELLSVGGIVASTIGDRAPQGAPIIVTCDGPRTRIYCVYDDDAIEGSEANEDALGYDPLKGNWAISIPCLTEDLDWVRNALKNKSSRITARDLNDGIASDESASASASGLVLNVEGFLGS